MNINWKKTSRMNRISEEDLKSYFIRYPNSHKRVIAICEKCGDERNVTFQQCLPLCLKCSHNTPEHIEAKRLRTIVYFADPTNLKNMSDMRKQQYIDDPELRKKPHDNNPDAWDKANENMRGGYDTLDHHMIYDHADPTKYVMKITRAVHSRLHRVFESHGIGIPHINVRLDNVDIFKDINKPVNSIMEA